MLKNYIWEIYELSAANDKPVDTGVDMLVVNLEDREGSFFYEGATDMDYAAATAHWETLTPEEKAEAKNEVRAIIQKHYAALCAAWCERDRDAFEGVLAE